MAEYTYTDRQILDTETLLWAAAQLLHEREAGAWTKQVQELHKRIVALAVELRDYNDQWEVDDDDE